MFKILLYLDNHLSFSIFDKSSAIIFNRFSMPLVCTKKKEEERCGKGHDVYRTKA
jgi:hypothetical protein